MSTLHSVPSSCMDIMSTNTIIIVLYIIYYILINARRLGIVVKIANKVSNST